jgi:hypothetical protein
LCDDSRFRCSLSQDIENVFRLAGINRAPLSDRCKQPLQYGFEPPLYCNVTDTSTAITRFQIGDVSLVLTEGIEIGEDHVAFDGSGIARADMLRVCVHPMHCLTDRFGFGGQQNGIALGFAHFGFAIDTGQATDARNHCLSFHEHIAADLSFEVPALLIQ